jgi:hypothetical protein
LHRCASKPELREHLKNALLDDGETVSAFMEKSLRDSVRKRKEQAEFIK